MTGTYFLSIPIYHHQSMLLNVIFIKTYHFFKFVSRKGQILHARLRLGCSSLNHDSPILLDVIAARHTSKLLNIIVCILKITKPFELTYFPFCNAHSLLTLFCKAINIYHIKKICVYLMTYKDSSFRQMDGMHELRPLLPILPHPPPSPKSKREVAPVI
jgi:hypothetical protein